MGTQSYEINTYYEEFYLHYLLKDEEINARIGEWMAGFFTMLMSY